MARGGGGRRSSPRYSSGGDWGVPRPDPTLRRSQRLSSSWSLLEEDVSSRRLLGSPRSLEEGEIYAGGVVIVPSCMSSLKIATQDHGNSHDGSSFPVADRRSGSVGEFKEMLWSPKGIVDGYQLLLENRGAVNDPGTVSLPARGSTAALVTASARSIPVASCGDGLMPGAGDESHDIFQNHSRTPTACQNASEGCISQIDPLVTTTNIVRDHSMAGDSLTPSTSMAIDALQPVLGLCRSPVQQPSAGAISVVVRDQVQ